MTQKFSFYLGFFSIPVAIPIYAGQLILFGKILRFLLVVKFCLTVC
jgi:hypothetical protein